jgi:D-alanine transaminase
VEGARTNLVVVDREGTPRTPPLARGAVSGVGLELLRELAPTVIEADVSRADLESARELIAINSVRGAVPVVQLDGTPVGDGTPGAVAAHLAEVLSASEEW